MRRSKYGAVRTVVDGITFASRKEARRYQELKLLALAGEIRSLKLQPLYDLGVNGCHICRYIPDFEYYERVKKGTGWNHIVEDVKGMKTPVYRLKKKLMLALENITVLET